MWPCQWGALHREKLGWAHLWRQLVVPVGLSEMGTLRNRPLAFCSWKWKWCIAAVHRGRRQLQVHACRAEMGTCDSSSRVSPFGRGNRSPRSPGMSYQVMVKKGDKEQENEYTKDGTVDLKGRPVLRSRTGRWLGCSFILGYEVFERIAYHGVASNLVIYLTTKLNEGTVEAVTNVGVWNGTVWLLPIIGSYIADAYLGRFWTFLVASFIYLSGLTMITVASRSSPKQPLSCGPGMAAEACKPQVSSFNRIFFYVGLYVIAIGNGGTKTNISSMGADQFDDYEPKERKQKFSFFNWWMSGVFIGSLIANTLMVYVQDHAGSSIGYGIQTIGLGLAVVVFLGGAPFYRHRKPIGSSMTRMAQVLVAAFRKTDVEIPINPKELHELSIDEYANSGKRRIENSRAMRFLDRAAVRTGPTSPWILCPVTQIEETKQLLRIIPIFIATITPSLIFAQVSTLFIKQGATLDLTLAGNFKIPPASLKALVQISMLTTNLLYDRCFVPLMRRRTKNPRGITILQRMGVGVLLHMSIMVAAYFAERTRLRTAREHGVVGEKQIVPLSVSILFPQFILLGLADTFLEAAKLDLFYDEAPDGMKSLGTSYYTTSMGLGSFGSSLLLNVVSGLSKSSGGGPWVTNNLNKSRLDYYYGLLAVMAFVNFLYYLVVARRFVYKDDTLLGYKEELAMSRRS
ncbi:hypothetical protein MLD38_020231 [Melastoma candidum]|uniref:Uncharacterized protein n=1 Tax=Melastoma candidum TaxID=119954 RepID=A0ACB9QCA9_9MYRT|nr:hypothetical protein MLD38_020231 [Melastoma candidum]